MEKSSAGCCVVITGILCTARVIEEEEKQNRRQRVRVSTSSCSCYECDYRTSLQIVQHHKRLGVRARVPLALNSKPRCQVIYSNYCAELREE